MSDRLGLFIVTLATYLAAAVQLVFVRHDVVPEALSRVANAYFVLYSRDPHLAAIGFVWNPLPSLLILPLLPFKALWPALSQVGFAGNILSALFMAAAVVQAYRLLDEQGVGRRMRLALALLFAIHPLSLYAGASGLPYALFLFCLLVAVRHLALWLENGQMIELSTCGIALGCAYLTGTEALIAAAGAIVLVWLVSFRRFRGRSENRAATAVCDVAILAGPILLVVVAWLAASWIITGDPLYQLSSVYGSGGRPATFWSLIVVLAPLLVLAVLGVAWIRMAGPQVLAGAALLVPLAAAMVVAEATGSADPSLHGLLMLLPLVLMLSGTLAATPRPASGLIAVARRSLAVIALAAALPAGALTLASTQLGGADASQLAPVLHAGTVNDQQATMANASLAAHYLDAKQLPPGSVLVDSASGFPIVLASANPRQFVLTNDRDFRLALSDPSGNAVGYLLIASSPDALNQTYRNLSSVGRLVEKFGAGAGVAWRLYQLSS